MQKYNVNNNQSVWHYGGTKALGQCAAEKHFAMNLVAVTTFLWHFFCGTLQMTKT